MQLPIIRCKNCGFEFSVEAKENMQQGRRWLEIDPDHGCPVELFIDPSELLDGPILD